MIKIKSLNKGEGMDEEKEIKKKSKEISKMSLGELKKLHQEKSEIYWPLKKELNEIAKFIKKKGGK